MGATNNQQTKTTAQARRWPLQLLGAIGQGALSGFVGALPGAAALAALEAAQPQLPQQVAGWLNVEAPRLRYDTAWPRAISAPVSGHVWLSYRFSPAQRVGIRLASRLGVATLMGAAFGPLAALARSGSGANGGLTGGAARQYLAGLGYGLALYAARSRWRFGQIGQNALREPLPTLRDLGLSRTQRAVIHAGGHALYGVALGALSHQARRVLSGARDRSAARARQASAPPMSHSAAVAEGSLMEGAL